MTAVDPMRSVVDYDRDSARDAARDAPDPYPAMTLAEALRDEQELFFDSISASPWRSGPARRPISETEAA